jgi:hypothetical protein
VEHVETTIIIAAAIALFYYAAHGSVWWRLTSITGLVGVGYALLKRTLPGLLLVFTSLAVLTFLTGSNFLSLLVSTVGITILLIESPYTRLDAMLKHSIIVLPILAYGTLFNIALVGAPILEGEPAWRAKIILSTPSGSALAFITTIIYFSLVTLWVLLPGESIPSVAGIASWLRRNWIAPLELYTILYIIAAVRVDEASLLGVFGGLIAYLWVKNAGWRRETSLLAFLAVFTSILYLLGILGNVDTYLSNL